MKHFLDTLRSYTHTWKKIHQDQLQIKAMLKDQKRRKRNLKTKE